MELYKKVYIKSEADLPQNNGLYIIWNNTAKMIIDNVVFDSSYNCKSYWMTYVNWYFIEAEQPEIQFPTDEEIEEKASGIANPESKKDFARGEWLGVKEGAKWMRSEILRRNES